MAIVQHCYLYTVCCINKCKHIFCNNFDESKLNDTDVLRMVMSNIVINMFHRNYLPKLLFSCEKENAQPLLLLTNVNLIKGETNTVHNRSHEQN